MLTSSASFCQQALIMYDVAEYRMLTEALQSFCFHSFLLNESSQFIKVQLNWIIDFLFIYMRKVFDYVCLKCGKKVCLYLHMTWITQPEQITTIFLFLFLLFPLISNKFLFIPIESFHLEYSQDFPAWAQTEAFCVEQFDHMEQSNNLTQLPFLLCVRSTQSSVFGDIVGNV